MAHMSKQDVKKQKTEYSILIFAILMVMTPLLLAGIIACFFYFRNGGMSWIPGLKWNDEAAYYQLIKTCVATGQPQGYWGFNGNHAIIGTGSAWSPAIIWPYAVFAFLFPLSKGFVYFVNLFYITLANAIFYLCVKPDKRACMRLILAQITSAVFILYLSVNMSEMFRYAIAIVLAGLLYQIFFGESPKFVKYVLTPLFIVGATQVYVFFAFCVPIYVFGIMRKSKLWKKLLCSLAGLSVVALGSYYLLHLISSNYNIKKTELLLNSLKSSDIGGAILAFLHMMKQGVDEVFMLWTHVYTNPLIPFHVLFCVILVLVSFGILTSFIIKSQKRRAVNRKENDKEAADTKYGKGSPEWSKNAILALIVAYSVLLFFGMYMTLYSIDPFTFMRGTYIVVIFSMYLLAMLHGRWIYRGILLLQAISLFFLPVNLDYYMTGHYMSVEEQNEWDMLEASMKDVIVLVDTENPWDNTVAMYTMEPKAICAMPAGAGINFVMDDGILPAEAEYLFFTQIPAQEQSTEWIVRDYERFCMEFGDALATNYNVIYDDGNYIVYQKAE